jgi:hypothetical protein
MKSLNLLCVLVLLLSNSFITGCENRDSEQTQPEIAVTNSYLQCVVEDLCREQTDVLCLAPPGMCPGHFDISPAQVNQLCKCRILLLFDFQKRLENSLLRIKEKGLKTASVCALPGFCLPKTYLAVCRDVCNILSAEYPDKKTQLQQRLKLIEKPCYKDKASRGRIGKSSIVRPPSGIRRVARVRRCRYIYWQRYRDGFQYQSMP